MRNAIILVFGVLMVSVAMTQPAHAYLDPGTGSYVFQVIAGAFFMIAVAVTTFKNVIINLFRRIFGKGGEQKKARRRDA